MRFLLLKRPTPSRSSTKSFDEFITDVTTQRTIARSDIADGRVFRGADALKINLVDRLGNLNDAIEGAQALANAQQQSHQPFPISLKI